MSGSIKYFVYTDDRGQDWAIRRDESNVEAVHGGTQDYPDGLNLVYELPRNVIPRTLVYRTADNRQTKRIPGLTPTIFAGINVGAQITEGMGPTPGSGTVFFLREKIGERVRVPFGQDTGLNDGDAT